MNKINIICIIATIQLCIPLMAIAGSLDAPAPPTSTGSAMYTSNDLYNRLATGTTGAKRNGPFSEPTAAPGSTGHTIDEIMAAAPLADNVNGATAGHVLAGKTFWGLRTDGTWGVKTGTSAAIPVLIAKTGQTIAFRPGDDGSSNKGVPSPSPRFEDNNNGTVTDNLTGLIWLKNANCTDTLGGVVKSSYINWHNAIIWSNNLSNGSCGLTDGSSAGQWRLPNVREIQSLIDYGNAYPALPLNHPFLNVLFDTQVQVAYWTSTTSSLDLNQSWYIWFATGYMNTATKSGLAFVWPVRGGQ